VSPNAAPRRVPIGNGWQWIVRGWRLVARKPLTWLMFTLVTWAIVSAGAIHPVVFAAIAVFLPVILAGWTKACVEAEAGRSIPVTMLFSGFRGPVRNLASIGGINLMVNMALMLVLFALGGDLFTTAMSKPETLTPDQAIELRDRMSVAMIIIVAIGLPMALAVWFAPVAVVLDGQRGPAALLTSLRAIVRNALPFALYTAVLIGLATVAFALFSALGLPRITAMEVAFWALMPLMVTSVYVSYRDIHPAEPTEESAAPEELP